MEIKDYDIKMDGAPQVFKGGAIRHTKTGKGRFDLIPSEVVCEIISRTRRMFEGGACCFDLNKILEEVYAEHYISAIASLVCYIYHKGFENPTITETKNFTVSFDDFIIAFARMLSDLAIHYEKGAEKYGENNWKKGIPVQSFRDSGLRHISQWISGATDEPHHISAIWNFFGLIYLINNPEKKRKSNDSLYSYVCQTLISNYFPLNPNSVFEMDRLTAHYRDGHGDFEVFVNRDTIFDPQRLTISGTIKGECFKYILSGSVFIIEKDHEAMAAFKNAIINKLCYWTF